MFARALICLVVVSGCAAEERAPGVNGDFQSRPFEEALAGPCAEGASRSCSIELGRNDDVVSCFVGTQVCRDGTWSICGAVEGGTVQAKRLSDSSSDLQAKSLSAPGAGAGICATNPCDPTCNGFDERPAASIGGNAVVSTWYENVVGFGGSPPGFVDKLVKEPCSSPADCGYDLHCDVPTRKCVRSLPGWTYSNAVCGAANITVGAACNVANRTKLPVCNRGNVAIPAGRVIKLAIRNGNWITAPKCPTVTAAEVNCEHTLTTPLFPGACATVDTCGISGNSVAFVNADFGVAECAGIGMTLGCADNWSDVKVVPCEQVSLTSYLPKTFTETYVAKCPISSRPAWQFLTYAGVTPVNSSGRSSIKFDAQTAPVLNGSVGTFGAPTTLADTAAGDPAACLPGVTSCPKNVFTALGGSPRAYEAAVRLTVSVMPTPDNLLTAVLQNWQLTYACVPSE